MFQVRSEVNENGYQINLFCEKCREVVDFFTSEEFEGELSPEEYKEEVKIIEKECNEGSFKAYFPGVYCEHYQ